MNCRGQIAASRSRLADVIFVQAFDKLRVNRLEFSRWFERIGWKGIYTNAGSAYAAKQGHIGLAVMAETKMRALAPSVH